ncbi:endochitinase A isoform X1 [Capsicum annuum]|uniref:endochitinase A isoform X1 n=1 Tax=Capsicum annuum TaxID=4072 RepID=UPI001FB0A3A7|nr:endochitinase A isoform X1 [Capsicum annuum]
MRFGFSSSSAPAASSPVTDDTALETSGTASSLPFRVNFLSTLSTSDSVNIALPPKTPTFFTFPPESSSTVGSRSVSASSSPVLGDSVLGSSATSPSWLFGASGLSTASSTDNATSALPPTKTSAVFTFPSVPSLPVTSVSEKPCDSTTTHTLYSGFSSGAFASSSFVSGDTAPPWLDGGSLVSTAASTDTATMPWFTNAISSGTTSAKTTSLSGSHIPPSDSLLSVTLFSSVSAIPTTVTAAAATSSLFGKASVSTSSSQSQPQSTVSAPEFVTFPACCSLEQDEVAAILASKCEKLLSCRAAGQTHGRGQNERHDSVAHSLACVATGFENTSSSKPVGDSAHRPAATAEPKFGESTLCSVAKSGAPSTSTLSVLFDSMSGSSLLRNSQPAEEQPYFPPVDLLHATIDMWKRVVADMKTDQEVIEEGLRHFYEGINYFCLLSERLQVTTDKYNEAAKARDDTEKMNSSLKDKLAEASRKLEDSKKEKKRLENELAGAEHKITALTGEKESILRVQTILHQTISELRRELEGAGPSAIQKYKASSLYRQELMEYAAPYMGKGVKLATEKIKAKYPTFDPATYGLEMYILPPEADDQEFSLEEESGGECQLRAELVEAKCCSLRFC